MTVFLTVKFLGVDFTKEDREMQDILGIIKDVCKTLKTLWKDEFYENLKEIAPITAHIKKESNPALEWCIFIFLEVVLAAVVIVSSLAIILFSSVCLIGIFILEIINFCIAPIKKIKGEVERNDD